MRTLLKVLLVGLASIAFVLFAGSAWFYFNLNGLPHIQSLAKFAPATSTPVTDSCLGNSIEAIPFESIGEYMRAALRASGVQEDSSGVVTQMLREATGQNHPNPPALSMLISRTVTCEPNKPLNRQLNEIHVAVQLERHFSRQELFTIYANRLYFDRDTIGVEEAAQHYFKKAPDQLRIEEAALIAGLVKSPSRFSPTRHPDSALQRRNEVIEAMLQMHFIGELEAAEAKSAPLQVTER